MKYGRLTILETYKKSGRIYTKCKCDCGNTKDIMFQSIKSGLTKSCGCIASEKALKKTKYFKEWRKKNHVEDTSLSVITRKESIKTNTSGTTGVTFDKSRGKWMATIGVQGKRIFLGRFDKKEDAVETRKVAEDKYFNPIIDKYKDKYKKD